MLLNINLLKGLYSVKHIIKEHLIQRIGFNLSVLILKLNQSGSVRIERCNRNRFDDTGLIRKSKTYTLHTGIATLIYIECKTVFCNIVFHKGKTDCIGGKHSL